MSVSFSFASTSDFGLLSASGPTTNLDVFFSYRAASYILFIFCKADSSGGTYLTTEPSFRATWRSVCSIGGNSFNFLLTWRILPLWSVVRGAIVFIMTEFVGEDSVKAWDPSVSIIDWTLLFGCWVSDGVSFFGLVCLSALSASGSTSLYVLRSREKIDFFFCS